MSTIYGTFRDALPRLPPGGTHLLVDDSLTTLDALLSETLPQLDNRPRTLIEAIVQNKFGLVRNTYCGDREDLENSLVVALLEWHRSLGSPDRFSSAAATAVLRKALIQECKRMLRCELLPGPTELPDGDWSHWNPAQPEDLLSDGRARKLASWRHGVALVVGELGAYVPLARLAFELPFPEIRRRLQNPDHHGCTDYRTAALLGFPHSAASVTVEGLERVFADALKLVKTKAKEGNWKSLEALLNPDEDE